MNQTRQPPPLRAVLETCLYHASAERDEIERFYGELLGLPRVAAWPDGCAFRLGPGVILLFDRERLAHREGPIAQHGSDGPGHACLLAEPATLETWKQRLSSAGVEITHEQEWSAERRSIYFADPAGNLLEIAGGDLWPPSPDS